jgi:hypothetical protein
MSKNLSAVLSSVSRARLEKPLVAQLIISHRDIAIGVERDCGLEAWGSNPARKKIYFSLFQIVQSGSGV